MQYSTPQFIEEEGKIIWFLTYRQFFVLIGGGAVCVLAYLILPVSWDIPVWIGIALITAAVAFAKVNNVSLPKALLNIILFTIGTKTYAWKQSHQTNTQMYEAKSQAQKEPQKPVPIVPPMTVRPSRLQMTQKIVDTKK